MKPTRTLLRGLEVLEALVLAREPIGPTGLADQVGLDKATVGRLLYTLTEAGYARPVHNGTYVPTSRLLRVASHVAVESELRDVARPHLVGLRDATGETVHLGIVEGDRVVYIDKLDGTHPVRLVSAVGQTMPLHTTSLGKAALAWMEPSRADTLIDELDLTPRTSRSIRTAEALRQDLAATRARGFSIDDRENEDQALCVGAAVLVDDVVTGMISVSGPSLRMENDLQRYGECVRAIASSISEDLSMHVGTNPD